MSTSIITLIPENPRFVPSSEAAREARDFLVEIASGADDVYITLLDNIQFFPCTENFERVLCPSCGAELEIRWWQDRMDEDYSDQGFRLAKYQMPCCQAAHTMHELDYDWPQGCGRFGLSAVNLTIGELNNEQRQRFESILGTRLRVIYNYL